MLLDIVGVLADILFAVLRDLFFEHIEKKSCRLHLLLSFAHAESDDGEERKAELLLSVHWRYYCVPYFALKDVGYSSSSITSLPLPDVPRTRHTPSLTRTSEAIPSQLICCRSKHVESNDARIRLE